MTQSVLIQSLPIIAKALGRNMGVRVEVNAGKARTDGNVIYLPELPINDPGVETLGLGLLIHEAGHIRYSDFSDNFYRNFTASKPLARSMSGAMEDIRMELCVIRDYPGSRVRLEELMAKLVNDGFFTACSDNGDPSSILKGYVLYFLRAYVLGQSALSAYADGAQALMAKLVTPLAMTRINSVIARVSSANNELEILALAQELTTVLEEEVKRQQPQQEPSQDTDDSDDESDSSDEATSQGSNEDDSDEPQDNSPSNSDSQDDGQPESEDDGDGSPQGGSPDSNDSSDGQGTQYSSESNNDDMSQEELEQAIQAMSEMLESEDDSSTGDLSDAFASLVSKEVDVAAKERGNYPVNSVETTVSDVFTASDHQKALDEAQAATSALRTRMIRLVQSNAKATRKTSRHGRRLNDRKVNRIAVGNPSVFKSVSKKKAVNTAVQILVDVSGSMQSVMELAMKSSLSITAALKAIPHLSAGTALFPGYLNSAVTVMTSHEQSVQNTAGYYPKVVDHGFTPLLPALVWSGDTLQARKESRKILIVITDGDPDSKNDCEDMLQRLRMGGIEVYGLGLGVAHKTMNDLFGANNAVVINDVGELAQATFSLLENTLYKAA